MTRVLRSKKILEHCWGFKKRTKSVKPAFGYLELGNLAILEHTRVIGEYAVHQNRVL
jgi:hypothetical protein